MSKTVLILGATGSFGGAMAQELVSRGRAVRCLVRDPAKARARFGDSPRVELVQGDAQDPTALEKAAADCEVIVHGINYPYHQWIPNMERVTNHVIAAAKSVKATILFPGNVYVFGLQPAVPLSEEAMYVPRTVKGMLRLQLEDSLREATAGGSTRVIVLRAGDYYGPTVRNGLVDPIFDNALKGKPIRSLGNLDIPHQWAFVPDLARAGAQLLKIRDRLRAYETVHFQGHIANPERDFLRTVARLAGHPNLPIRRYPWWLLKLVGFFARDIKELMELRYLFETSILIAGHRLRRLLPNYVDTPVEESIRITLDSYARS